MPMHGRIYTGYDRSNPDTLEHHDDVTLYDHEDLPRDYAWRALGDHIASGPGDVPQTVDVEIDTPEGPIRVRAQLSYVNPKNGRPYKLSRKRRQS